MRRPAIAHQLDAHCIALGDCRRCVRAPDVKPIASRARAPRAMLVGQAPGQTETGGGRPFAGRAGRTLFKWFAQAGIEEETARDWLYISAVTRCFPGPHKSGRGDRVPSPAERAACSSWLDDELRIIQPSLVIPVGRLAIDRFLGAMPLASLVGREHMVRHPWGECVVIPLPHPSGASSWIHTSEHKALLDGALALIGERLNGVSPSIRSVA